jgi:hypothetical protein
VELKDMLIESSKHKRNEILKQIDNECKNLNRNRDYQFYLGLILQMRELDLKYQVFVVMQAIQDPRISEDSERDLLNEKLFNVAYLL